jgi:acyl carrier protein
MTSSIEHLKRSATARQGAAPDHPPVAVPNGAILERVIGMIAGSAGLPAASISSATAVERLAIDSLDVLDLLFRPEDEFGVRLPPQSDFSARTVGDAVALSADELERQPSSSMVRVGHG